VRLLKSAPLLLSLAALASGAAAAAPPAEAGGKDVTITVVDDPEQLSEKVNRISLPADHDNAEAARDKDHGHDRPAEHGREAAENAKQDAKDAQQQDAHHGDRDGA
jgi:hypothetical protein